MKNDILLETDCIKRPVKGLEQSTFVNAYKGQSQLHVNTINGANLSGEACEVMIEIRRIINGKDEPVETEKPKTRKKTK